MSTSPWSRLSPRAATAAAAVAVAAAVFGLALAALRTVPAGQVVASWWPVAGVAVGAVAVSPAGRRVAVLLAVAVGVLPAALLAGRSPAVAACVAVAATAGAGLTGWWLGRRGPPELSTLRDLGRLLAAAGAGALLAGGIAAVGVGQLVGGDPWATWWAVLTAHGAAVVVLVPQVMRMPAHAVPVGGVEVTALWAAVLATTLAVFAPGQRLPLQFLVVLVLVWASLRVGLRVTSLQLVVVAVLTVLLTLLGAAPFAAAGGAPAPVAGAVLVQAYLVGCALIVFGFTLAVAQRDAVLATLADQRRFDQAILEVVSAGVVACDAEGRIVLRNAAHRRVAGVRDDEAVHPTVLDDRVQVCENGVVLPPARRPLRRALAGEELVGVPLQIGPVGGLPHDVVVMARPIHSADGRLLGAVSAFTDVTVERAAQARLQDGAAFHDAVLAVIPDDIYLLDLRTLRTVWASRTLPSRLGYDPTEVRDRGWGMLDALVHPDDAEVVRASYAAAAHLADGEVQALRVRVRARDGHYRWLSRRLTPFSRDPDGRVRQLLGVRHASELVEAEQRLAEAALHDPLTGLPNRRLFTDRLDAALAHAAGADELVAVLFCDLDGFKSVNDSGGHAAGDMLLRASAQRLRAVLRPEDTVARVGGDEFVVILTAASAANADGPVDLRDAAVAVARRIIGSLNQPIEAAGGVHAVTVSVGVTFARPGDDPEQTLRDADTAMYRAKARGKNRYELYNRGRPARRERRVSGA